MATKPDQSGKDHFHIHPRPPRPHAPRRRHVSIGISPLATCIDCNATRRAVFHHASFTDPRNPPAAPLCGAPTSRHPGLFLAVDRELKSPPSHLCYRVLSINFGALFSFPPLFPPPPPVCIHRQTIKTKTKTGPAGARMGADGRLYPCHPLLGGSRDWHELLCVAGLSAGGVHCCGVLVRRHGDDIAGRSSAQRSRRRPRGF